MKDRPSPSLLDVRLRRQRLSADQPRRPVEVVAWLGAMQAQDYIGAKWGLGLRTRSLSDAQVEAAFNDGRILRTHVLRPTWHFVAPADIRWLLALTGPRVQTANLASGRRLGLEARTFTRARVLIERALEGGHHLTRAQIADVLRQGRISVSGQPLAHLLMHAELEGAICSGPREAGQFTYALLAERAPTARPPLPRDEALGELARRYFQSHGPATAHDFAWWAGLTLNDAREGATVASVELLREPPTMAAAPGAHLLLPNYDEYLIAYKHRGAVLDSWRARNLGVFTRIEYPHHVILDGRVAGTWQRRIAESALAIQLRLYRTATARQLAALRKEADRYARFLGVRNVAVS